MPKQPVIPGLRDAMKKKVYTSWLAVTSRVIVDPFPEQLGPLALPVLEGVDRAGWRLSESLGIPSWSDF
jgi:hypothetical protein